MDLSLTLPLQEMNLFNAKLVSVRWLKAGMKVLFKWTKDAKLLLHAHQSMLMEQVDIHQLSLQIQLWHSRLNFLTLTENKI